MTEHEHDVGEEQSASAWGEHDPEHGERQGGLKGEGDQGLPGEAAQDWETPKDEGGEGSAEGSRGLKGEGDEGLPG
jgi:hypothetical protein